MKILHDILSFYLLSKKQFKRNSLKTLELKAYLINRTKSNSYMIVNSC